MTRQGQWRQFDIPLLVATVMLTCLGIAMIYSATSSPGLAESSLKHLAFRQVIFGLSGLALLFLAASVDYRLWAEFRWPLYLVALVLLVAVLINGRVLHGAQRWLDLGPVPLQPSELAKVLVIIVLAHYLQNRRESGGNPWATLGISLAIAAVPAFLIYLEPDLGTALVVMAIWLGMVLVGGVHPKYVATLALPTIPALPLIWRFVLKGYMRERLITFISPEADPLGAGYNTIQARISIGSGGLWGAGYQAGSQSQLQFLRVRHTDYIFSVLAEELGFVGAVLLLVLLAIVILRTLRIGARGEDGFGELIACGVAITILFQSFVNIGMNLGIVPATGITLPFVSHGGSSLVSLMLAQGLVQSVAMHRRRAPAKAASRQAASSSP